MSALSPKQTRAMRETTRRHDGASPFETGLAGKWKDLHARAARLAKMAELSPEPFEGAIADFPGQVSRAPDWQRELAWQGIDDIEAMMRPGLAALETLCERGTAANAPALALWREFYNARGAIMSLARH